MSDVMRVDSSINFHLEKQFNTALHISLVRG